MYYNVYYITTIFSFFSPSQLCYNVFAANTSHLKLKLVGLSELEHENTVETNVDISMLSCCNRRCRCRHRYHFPYPLRHILAQKQKHNRIRFGGCHYCKQQTILWTNKFILDKGDRFMISFFLFTLTLSLSPLLCAVCTSVGIHTKREKEEWEKKSAHIQKTQYDYLYMAK